MDEPTLIIQVTRGGAIDRQFSAKPPASVAAGEVVVEAGPTDADGVLEQLAVGKVVASFLSPEALRREADELRRVISRTGPGDEPLVIVVRRARSCATTSSPPRWRRRATPRAR